MRPETINYYNKYITKDVLNLFTQRNTYNQSRQLSALRSITSNPSLTITEPITRARVQFRITESLTSTQCHDYASSATHQTLSCEAMLEQQQLPILRNAVRDRYIENFHSLLAIYRQKSSLPLILLFHITHMSSVRLIPVISRPSCDILAGLFSPSVSWHTLETRVFFFWKRIDAVIAFRSQSRC